MLMLKWDVSANAPIISVRNASNIISLIESRISLHWYNAPVKAALQPWISNLKCFKSWIQSFSQDIKKLWKTSAFSGLKSTRPALNVCSSSKSPTRRNIYFVLNASSNTAPNACVSTTQDTKTVRSTLCSSWNIITIFGDVLNVCLWLKKNKVACTWHVFVDISFVTTVVETGKMGTIPALNTEK